MRAKIKQEILEASRLDLTKIRFKTFNITKKEMMTTLSGGYSKKELSSLVAFLKNGFINGSTREELLLKLKEEIKHFEDIYEKESILSRIVVASAPYKTMQSECREFGIAFSISSPEDIYDRIYGRTKALLRLLAYSTNQKLEHRDKAKVGTIELCDNVARNSFMATRLRYTYLSEVYADIIINHFAKRISWLKDIKYSNIK